MKNGNTRIVFIVLAALVVLAVGVYAVSHLTGDSAVQKSKITEEESVTDNESGSELTNETQTDDSESFSEMESSSVSESEAEPAKSGTESSRVSDSAGGSTGPSTNSASSKRQVIDMSFPFTSESDQIQISDLYNYSGYYIEDGSETEVDGVGVILVTNLSSKTIEYASIQFLADNTPLTFEVSLLPAGATAMVMEANKQAVSESASCGYLGSQIAYATDVSMCEDRVRVTNDGNGVLTVTNIGGNDIPEMRLFYKNQLDTGEFIGGIAYTVKLENVAAGTSYTVNPSHFDPEAGVVMMVRIYE